MIRSIKGTATRQFVTRGRSSFPGLNVERAFQRLAELNAAPEPLGDIAAEERRAA